MGSEIDRLFEVALDLLLVLDAKGRIQRLNPAFLRLLGYTEEEMRAGAPLDFIHPDDVQATLKVMRRVLAGEVVVDFVNRTRCKDGSYRELSWRGVAQPDGLVFAIGRDVTDVRRSENQLRALYELSLQFQSGSSEQFQRFLIIAKSYLGMEEGVIARVIGDVHEVRFHSPDVGAPSRIGERATLAQLPATLAVEANDVVTVRYMSRSDHAGRPWVQPGGREAFIGVPLHVEGELYGVLTFSSATPRVKVWALAERRLMKMLRSWVGTMLSNRDAITRLAVNEDYMRRLDVLDEASDSVGWRYLEQVLPLELARARERGMPLSALVLHAPAALRNASPRAGDGASRWWSLAVRATRRVIELDGFVCRGDGGVVAVLPGKDASAAAVLGATVARRLDEVTSGRGARARVDVVEQVADEGADELIARLERLLAGDGAPDGVAAVGEPV